MIGQVVEFVQELVEAVIWAPPGLVYGVTEEELVPLLTSPKRLVAVTVNVYALPFVRPVTRVEVSDAFTVVEPPDQLTTYESMAVPLPSAADQETSAFVRAVG